MKNLLITLILLSSPLSLGDDKWDTIVSEAKQAMITNSNIIDGKWKPTALFHGGERLDQRFVEYFHKYIIIDNGRFLLENKVGQRREDSRIVILSSDSQLRLFGGRYWYGKLKMGSVKGIYQVRGGMLLICVNSDKKADFPNNFQSTKDNNCQLLVCRYVFE